MLSKIKVPSYFLVVMVIWTQRCCRWSSPLLHVGGYWVRSYRVGLISLPRQQGKSHLCLSTPINEKSKLLVGNEIETKSIQFSSSYNNQVGNSNDPALIEPYLNPSTTSMLSTPTLLESALNRIQGSREGYYIVKMYKTNPAGFDLECIPGIQGDDLNLERLEITTHNISVPLALMMLDPEEYPSASKARKACRKANILIHRGPLQVDVTGREVVFDANKCQRARVGDRVLPGDVLAKEVRIGDGVFPTMYHKKPPFELPVIFEDDHFAIGRYIISTAHTH
jgi:hypothetical protein